MGGAYTRMPQQRAVGACMVPAAGRYHSDILPLGTGTVVRCRNGATTESAGCHVCGVTGTEGDILQRCGTFRNTAYR